MVTFITFVNYIYPLSVKYSKHTLIGAYNLKLTNWTISSKFITPSGSISFLFTLIY